MEGKESTMSSTTTVTAAVNGRNMAELGLILEHRNSSTESDVLHIGIDIDMDAGIEHRTIVVNGINMHIAEKGQGPVVLLLHGLPELWYSWKHQIVSLASYGYRAVAPDLRGFGDTDAPTSFYSYTTQHIVGDLIALIHALGQDKVFVVAHDWGAFMAWSLCLYRPDLVKGYVSLSVPFIPRNPLEKPVEHYQKLFGDDFYMVRIQESGEIEREIADTKDGVSIVIKKFFTLRDPGPIMIPKDKWLQTSGPIPLPSWLSEKDVDVFVSKFEQKGFTGGLNYIRAFDLNWELTSPWTGAKVTNVPCKYIVGEEDFVYNIPGRKEYIHDGRFKRDVPLLEDIVVIEGAAHFIQQERPEEITQHIYDFIKKF